MARDPYQELGVSRQASAAEIRKAFHKLAKSNHPDVNPGDKASEERFKRASAAFDLLGDAEKRKKFDAGEIDGDGHEIQRGFPGGAPFGQGAPEGFDFNGVDINDIINDMLRGQGRGGGRRGGGRAARGGDIRASLEIDLEEAILGAKKRLSFHDGPTLDVTIPAGAMEGQVLRLKGQGAPGRGGPGDALIELSIRPHPVYRREGDSLVMDLRRQDRGSDTGRTGFSHCAKGIQFWGHSQIEGTRTERGQRPAGRLVGAARGDASRDGGRRSGSVRRELAA